jgi:hypothetical protein
MTLSAARAIVSCMTFIGGLSARREKHRNPNRPTVATAAGMLQEAGLISYRYGKLSILNPEGLADGACECYHVMEAQFERIFDQPWSTDQREPSFEPQ